MRAHRTEIIEWSGRICAVCAKKSALYIATGATRSSKGRLIRYDLCGSASQSVELPDRAQSLVPTDLGIAAVLADGRVWLADEQALSGRFVSMPAASPVRAIARLKGTEIALLTRDRMAVIDLEESLTRATSSMPEEIAPALLVSHPSAQRLVVGLQNGTLLAFTTAKKDNGFSLELAGRRTLSNQLSGPLSFDSDGDIIACQLDGSVASVPWNTKEPPRSWRHRFAATAHLATAHSGHIYAATRAGRIWHLGRKPSCHPRAADERLFAVVALDVIRHEGKNLLMTAEENGRFLFFGLDASGRIRRPVLELRAAEQDDAAALKELPAKSAEPLQHSVFTLAQVCEALPFEPDVGLTMLGRLLQDPRPHVRMDAFWLAASLFAPLRDELRSDPHTGESLAFVIQKCSDQGAAFPDPIIQEASVIIGLLLEAMTCGLDDVRLEAAHCLASLKDRRCMGTLLELSGFATPEIRRRACAAMGRFDDPLFLSRLEALLEDPQPRVRAAAYAAVEKMRAQRPLDASQAGSTSMHSDVRLAALRTLDAGTKASARERMPPRALALLERGLSDEVPSVRDAAFRIVVDRIGRGDEEIAVHLAISSQYRDIRDLALSLIEQELSRPWVYSLILELFDDRDPALRSRAVACALEGKGRPDGEQVRRCLERAMQSRHTDVRCAAISHLPRSDRRWILDILLRALDDPAAQVRKIAIENIEHLDSGDSMVVAMNSRHRDVRVRAAHARARLGDTLAFDPLIRQLRAPPPEDPQERTGWREQMLLALEGIEPLESSEASVKLRALLDGDDVIIRHRAARTLAWTAPAEDFTAFRGTLTHPDPTVQVIASAALTWRGVPLEISSLRRCDDDDTLEVAIAALFVGDPRLFARLYEHRDPTMRLFALTTAVFCEKRRGLCGEFVSIALGSADPTLRFRAARALEPSSVTSQQTFDALVDPLESGSSQFVGVSTRERVTRAIVRGNELLAARMLKLLAILAFEGSQRFEQSYELLASRHAPALSELDQDTLSIEVPPRENARKLLPLCLGIYAGLATNEKDVPSGHRLAAIRRLTALTHQGWLDIEEVSPSLHRCLVAQDPETGRGAFDALEETGCAPGAIASSALESGHRDIQSRALRLLTAAPGGMSQIRRIATEYTCGLEHEAYAVLTERDGRHGADRFAIDAASPSLRDRVLAQLRRQAGPPGFGTEILRSALASRFDSVRLAAAESLLRIAEDSAARETLLRLAMKGETETQNRAIDLLGRFPNGKSADALHEQLGQSEPQDPTIPALLAALGRCAGLRHTKKILSLTEYPATKEPAVAAALAIVRRSSAEDKSDIERAASIILCLIDTARSDHELLARVTKEILPLPHERLAVALFELVGHKDAAVARASARCLSGIIPALPAAQIMARKLARFLGEDTPTEIARGLALAGDSSGAPALRRASRSSLSKEQITNLLSALETLGYRQGTSILFEAARGRNPVLARQAALALSSFGAPGCPRQIVDNLAELSRLGEAVAYSALEGLRRCDHPAAWEAIRAATRDKNPALRRLAVELLAFDGESASRQRLEHIIEADTDPRVVLWACQSLRSFFEPESLEPDRLYVRSHRALARTQPVDRLARLEPPPRLFALSQKIKSPQWRLICEHFAQEMNKRTSLSDRSLSRALRSDHPRVLFTAAALCGLVADSLSDHIREEVLGAAARVRDRWDALSKAPGGRHSYGPDTCVPPDTIALAATYARLVWCCGRLGVGEEELISAAFCEGPELLSEEIRCCAALALAQGSPNHAVTEALAALACAANAHVRDTASAALAHLNPAVAAQLAYRAFNDRPNLMRLLDSDERRQALPDLRRAATMPEVLASACPLLAALEDVDGLSAIATDSEAPRMAQLTAIAALSDIGAAARAPLRACASSNEVEPVIRRAAYRGLRRVARTKKKTFTSRVLRGGEP